MATSLAAVHLGATDEITDVWLDTITEKVVGSDVRVLHFFATHDVAEYLLVRAQDSYEDVSLPHEDFVFSKLRLADGCTSAPPGSTLRSKGECNTFLKKVAEKLWHQLRGLLRQFDTTDLLRQLLALHE